MPLTPEELKEAHRKGGYIVWKNKDTMERSAILSAVRKGIKKGNFPTYKDAVEHHRKLSTGSK